MDFRVNQLQYVYRLWSVVYKIDFGLYTVLSIYYKITTLEKEV